MRRKRRKFPEKIAKYEEYSCITIIFRIFKLLFVKLLLLLQKNKNRLNLQFSQKHSRFA